MNNQQDPIMDAAATDVVADSAGDSAGDAAATDVVADSAGDATATDVVADPAGDATATAAAAAAAVQQTEDNVTEDNVTEDNVTEDNVTEDSSSLEMLKNIISLMEPLKTFDCENKDVMKVINTTITTHIALFDKIACIKNDIPYVKKIDWKDKYYKMSIMLATACEKLKNRIDSYEPGDTEKLKHECSEIKDQVNSLNKMADIINGIITHSDANSENKDALNQFSEIVETIETFKQQPGVDRMVTLVTALYDLINNPDLILTDLPKIASASGNILALLKKQLLLGNNRTKCEQAGEVKRAEQTGGSFHKRTRRKTKKLNGIALDKIKNSVSRTDKTRKRIIKNFLKFTRKKY